MSSAWGDSWGQTWGVSWDIVVTPPVVVASVGAGGQVTRKRRRKLPRLVQEPLFTKPINEAALEVYLLPCELIATITVEESPRARRRRRALTILSS